MTTLKVGLPGRGPLFAGLVGLAVAAVLAVGTLAIVASRPTQTPQAPTQTPRRPIQGIRWQPATHVARTHVSFGPFLATAGGRLFMLGDSGTVTMNGGIAVASDVSTVWSSADGATWEQVSEPASFEANGSRFVPLGFSDDGNGGLVVVGNTFAGNDFQGASAWHSSDGRTWTRAQVGAPDWSEMVSVAARPGAIVAFGDHREPVIITATATANAQAADELVAWFSADGDTWSRAILPDSAGYVPRVVTAWRGGFAAVAHYAYASDTVSAAWTSTDGCTWEKAPTELIGFDVNAMAVLGDRVVAVGSGFDDKVGTVPASWSSTDGRTWVESTAPARQPVTAFSGLTVMGDALVATGGSVLGYIREDTPPPTPPPSVWISSNGLTWQLLPADPGLTIYSGRISTIGGRLVLAGSTASGVDVLLGDLVRD